MNDELYAKVDKGVDNVNTILADVRAQKGTIGKLLYDPSLYDQAKSALENGNTIMGDIRAGKGTLGKLATTMSFTTNFATPAATSPKPPPSSTKTTTPLANSSPTPSSTDNLAAASTELRTFLTEFRKNPKKIPNVKMSFF